jgi:hydroxymethylpyrimidine pyrophosphatase-like HAD family hydrolase
MRTAYLDLDGTLLGPGGGVFRAEDGSWSLDGVRALQACHRAGAEVVLVSGRARRTLAENARLLGVGSYVCELGACVVVDGCEHWLTGRLVPSAETGSVHEQIAASGAPALLFERFAGRLEEHEPWHAGREVSHLLRGLVDRADAEAFLAEHGYGELRLLDNGVVERRSPALAALPEVRAYHLLPAEASKAAGVARHQELGGLDPAACLAVGDSAEDLGMSRRVGTFVMVANAIARDPSLAAAVAATPGARVARASHGAGVLEAVEAWLGREAA